MTPSSAARSTEQRLGAADATDKSKLSVRKPEERKEAVAKVSAPSPKTFESKLAARLISGAKQLRKTVPLDGPTPAAAAAAPETITPRATAAVTGSALATQRQTSATIKGISSAVATVANSNTHSNSHTAKIPHHRRARLCSHSQFARNSQLRPGIVTARHQTWVKEDQVG